MYKYKYTVFVEYISTSSRRHSPFLRNISSARRCFLFTARISHITVQCCQSKHREKLVRKKQRKRLCVHCCVATEPYHLIRASALPYLAAAFLKLALVAPDVVRVRRDFYYQPSRLAGAENKSVR